MAAFSHALMRATGSLMVRAACSASMRSASVSTGAMSPSATSAKMAESSSGRAGGRIYGSPGSSSRSVTR
jgi:hypothetical protein